MRIGVVIDETWSFFKEIYAELQAHHQTELFQPRKFDAPFLKDRLNRRLYRASLSDFIRRQDVVFFEWASEHLMHASRLSNSTPLVTRLHRYELYHWAHQINWCAVDRIILVTKAKQEEFSRRFPEFKQRTTVIPEAVSLERFRSQIRPFNGDLGILCHLTPRKRVYELVLAFSELLKIDPSFKLHIGGGEHVRFGDYHEAIRQLVVRLNLHERVIFYGNVPDPENWYRNIDVIISNSYSEGLQVSPLEAIASGCYGLSHRWEGASEFYPPENLYNSDQELIEEILAYSRLSQAEKEDRIHQLQNILKSQFDLDRTKVQVRQEIESAASKGSAGRGG